MYFFENPLVSVIVPVYKSENYIETCIKSILGQSYQNLEAILVIDGKADNSPEICRKYARIDSRVIIYEQSNAGVAVARNKGLELAKGEYILFVDSDDWIEPQCVDVLLSKALETQSEITISGFYRDYVNESKRDRFFVYDKQIFTTKNKKDLLMKCIDGDAGATLAKIYKKSLIDDSQIRYIPGLKRMEDSIFNLHAFWHASKVVLIPEYLYHYTMDSNSATWRYDADYSETAKIILKEIGCFIQTTNCLYLNDAKQQRTIILSIEITKQQFVARDDSSSRKERIRGLKNIFLCDDYPFKENIKRIKIGHLNGRLAAAALLLKLRLYTLFYLYCEFRYKQDYQKLNQSQQKNVYS